jgi:predicted transcriptional regulator
MAYLQHFLFARTKTGQIALKRMITASIYRKTHKEASIGRVQASQGGGVSDAHCAVSSFKRDEDSRKSYVIRLRTWESAMSLGVAEGPRDLAGFS